MTERELLLTTVRKCRRIDLYVDPRPLTAQEQSLFDDMVSRYDNGEPLQYIIGECDFLGNTIAVNPNVLIPRPETEILVDTIIQKLKPSLSQKPCKILDLGTGSGSIAISLAKAFDSCQVTAMDISQEAIDVATNNAVINGVSSQIQFICVDMLKCLTNGSPLNKDFDCIVSNPPYIKTSELDNLPVAVRKEPRLALDGGADGLKFYRAIIAHAHQYLNADGFLFLEIGDEQRMLIEELMTQYHFYRDLEFYQDYTKTDRIVSARRNIKAWKN